MIVGDGTYVLEGTPAQQAIVAACFDPASPAFIRFPWAKLSPPAKPIPIGWQDLNAAGQRFDHHRAHTVVREIEGREWTAGVFWTDGRIYIDYRCETNPALAREVVSAELAHSVDFFLPLTDAQKKDLMFLWHGGYFDDHTWWEKADYGGEYAQLGGEAFMAAFTLAWSDMKPDDSQFTHRPLPADSPRVRAIVGVDGIAVVRIGNRPKYHRPTCLFVRAARALSHRTAELDLEQALALGLVGCRRCRPEGTTP